MASSRDQLLQSAEKYVAKGKLDQALKDYLRVLEENPKDIATLNRVGDLYVRMNRQADSIPFFTRIADFYSKDGFFLKAIAIYKKINKIDPARLEVYERLAELYHKQGLVQDSRSQYQVLADHYQKNNRLKDAIAVYKKMAAIDSADLRIQVRLADLYRTAGQKDQAVMQYGLIGSMLLKRGAHDEAAQVFQKAPDVVRDEPLLRQARDGRARLRAGLCAPWRHHHALIPEQEGGGLRQVLGLGEPLLQLFELRIGHLANFVRTRRGRRCRSESSRPPVSPAGRRINTRAMRAPTTTIRVPAGRSSERPKTWMPLSASARNESTPLTTNAPTTAPQRLVAPPITSIASVMKVRSRYTDSVFTGSRWT